MRDGITLLDSLGVSKAVQPLGSEVPGIQLCNVVC